MNDHSGLPDREYANAKVIRNSDLQKILERVSLLRGILVAVDEIGIPASEEEDVVLAVTSLMTEARAQVKDLAREIKVLMHA
jgi:hypothetical protein